MIMKDNERVKPCFVQEEEPNSSEHHVQVENNNVMAVEQTAGFEESSGQTKLKEKIGENIEQLAKRRFKQQPLYEQNSSHKGEMDKTVEPSIWYNQGAHGQMKEEINENLEDTEQQAKQSIKEETDSEHIEETIENSASIEQSARQSMDEQSRHKRKITNVPDADTKCEEQSDITQSMRQYKKSKIETSTNVLEAEASGEPGIGRPYEQWKPFAIPLEQPNEGQYEVKVEIETDEFNVPTDEGVVKKRREHRMTSVMYVEHTRDDNILYCVDCKQEHEGDCPVHGPLIVVQNMKVEENDPDRALHSLPSNLLVKETDIDGAGLGVFTDTEIQPGTTYGPYEGMYITDPEVAEASAYCWQIKKESGSSHFIDGEDKASSNWMRYVNCAPSDSDQNLAAFQYKSGIYYRCIKPILPKTELLVWYGDDCARKLGISKRSHDETEADLAQGEAPQTRTVAVETFSHNAFDKPLNTATLQILKTDKSYKCDICCKAFDDSLALSGHMNVHSIEQPGIVMYKCDICERTFDHSKSFSLHAMAHSEEKFYKCDSCEVAFCQISDLKRHNFMMVHTFERPFGCNLCDKTFKQGCHLSYHIKIHKGVKSHKCDKCDKTFIRKCDLKKHDIIHTDEKPFVCNFCEKKFRQNSHLKVHMLIHTREKQFQCKECDKAFQSSSECEKHMKTHIEEKHSKCEVCDKVFETSLAFEKHKELHTRRFKCEICHKAFFEKSTLKKHMVIHTNVRERKYKCDHCNKAFFIHNSLKEHITIHTGEKPFVCELCGRAFRQSHLLKDHITLHTGERPFKCDICDKTVRTSSELSRHRKKHTEHKPYKCIQCDETFKHIYGLNNHRSMHGDGKTYECNICYRKFFEIAALNKHMLIHTADRPFKCDHCGKAFFNDQKLKRHAKIHTGNKPFVCKICYKGFFLHHQLKDHMSKHTGEKLYECGVCEKAFKTSREFNKHRKTHAEEKLYNCRPNNTK